MPCWIVFPKSDSQQEDSLCNTSTFPKVVTISSMNLKHWLSSAMFNSTERCETLTFTEWKFFGLLARMSPLVIGIVQNALPEIEVCAKIAYTEYKACLIWWSNISKVGWWPTLIFCMKKKDRYCAFVKKIEKNLSSGIYFQLPLTPWNSSIFRTLLFARSTWPRQSQETLDWCDTFFYIYLRSGSCISAV